jgi:outer membrane protein assembly factor BamB
MPRGRRLALALVLLVGAVPLAARPTGAATLPLLWPTYHADLARTGADTADAAFTQISRAWTTPQLDGAVYAEPLVDGNTVIVATENDSLYGLDASNGAVLWHTTVGTPVPLSSLPCGNINPLGITGTPALDSRTNIVYAVAEVTGPHHVLVGLDAGTGAVVMQRTIDPPGQDPTVQQQRAALSLANGLVYVPLGGLLGDCGNYHGWVVASQVDGGGPLYSYEVAAGSGRGGIWAPSGAAIDGAGNVYVATGNSNTNGAWDGGDSVLKLSPTLQLLDWFAPSDYAQLNASDTDLGSTGPSLVNGGLLFQVGKGATGYLVATGHLGNIGGQVFAASVCAAYGGNAYADPYIYVPCTDGVRAVRLSGASFSVAWHGPGGAAGSPIVAGGLVWVLDYNGGIVYALDPASGAVRYQDNAGAMHHFATPAAAGGRVFVAAGSKVVAYSGGNPAPPPAPPPPPGSHGYWLVARDGGIFTFGAAPYRGSMGGTRLNAPVVGMAHTTDYNGYWLVATDGGIFSFGDARFRGSAGNVHLAAPIVGMAATPSGNGYWLVAADGGIFTYGDARFLGSMGGQRLNAPIVGMAASPSGNGYWLAAGDGGIFAFGDAAFAGSMGGRRLNAPVVGIAAAGGSGYWLVASDGGIFAFGGAPFTGSTGAMRLNAPMVGLAGDGGAAGYRLMASDGGVFCFGPAFFGSMGGSRLNAPITGTATF